MNEARRSFKSAATGLLWLFLGVGASVTACSTTGSLAPNWRQQSFARGSDEDKACLADFKAFDAAVKRAGVRDGEAARVRGFPYLKVNRFLASFRKDDLEGKAFDVWVQHMRALDAQARFVEASNLGGAELPSLVHLDECAALLIQSDLTHTEARAGLIRAATVMPSYNLGKRLSGFYPLTSIGVALGYRGWQKEALPSFSQSLESLEAENPWTSYRPTGTSALSHSQVAALMRAAPRDALGIPQFERQDLNALLQTFAPIWRVETTGAYDRAGAPAWRGSEIVVDPSHPPVFARLSYTRFGGAVLPQLVYMIWFPERPKQSRFDLLGGPLDAVVWRVTLNADGQPLIYDSMHACGCYHMFFPVPPLSRKPMPEDQDARESALVPISAPVLGPGQRMVVRLATVSHYVSSVSGERGQTEGASFAYNIVAGARVPDQVLRIAPTGAGRSRSLYGENGIIRQSARLERFTLWPMGIDSPGAMRQWGTHATAFVGLRHFDDPYLMQEAFH